MRWVFAIGIPVYFWWVSLKEKDRKNPSPPTLCFIPAIVLELCVVAMLQSVERLSCLSPPCSLFFFSPLQLILYSFMGIQAGCNTRSWVWRQERLNCWIAGCRRWGFSEQMRQWVKHCHVPRPCPYPATTLAAHGCPSRAEMLPDAGPSLQLKYLTCEESLK